uniref:Uncharacterized protein n=1 Tax=Anguilla anguilla TaxID=7936 RepID=A0A0E9S3A9_ANGAN
MATARVCVCVNVMDRIKISCTCMAYLTMD